MGQLIEFPDRSDAGHDAGDPYKMCACGEAWFTIEGFVTMSTDGRIVGHSGVFTCASCGMPIAS